MNLSKKDMKYVDIAFNIAKKSEMTMKHGCVITCNNKMVSSGYNNYRNKYNDGIIGDVCSCHAEMDALRNAIKNKTKGSCLPSLSTFSNRKQYRFKKGCYVED